ncbi:MAG: alanine racemase [Clostridiaceae bacterium]|nr:alanine racemase [Clostridiaceae bacterium]
MQYMKDRTWMEISLDAIEENYRRVKNDIGDKCGVMAVVKANAYGLGAVYLSKYLESLGCDFFACACIEEAMELRDGGIKSDILTLGPVMPEYLEVASDNGIITNIISLAHAKALSSEAVRLKKTIRGHIKADAGLGRFGIVLEGRMDQAVEEALEIAALPGIKSEGVFTHYTAADIPRGDEFNKHQIGLFDEFTDKLSKRGLRLVKHSASSYFTSVYPECHNDYVRIASLLLGIDAAAPRGTVCVPAVQLKSRIYQIKEIGIGRPVSYGPICHTLRKTKVAVVPVGYADGIRRTIQTKASLLVNGQWAPIIGKMCMDYLMLDVTDIEAHEGDEVVIIGRSGDKTQEVWDMAGLYGATVGEVPTVITMRVPRFYTRGGEIVGRMDD